MKILEYANISNILDVLLKVRFGLVLLGFIAFQTIFFKDSENIMYLTRMNSRSYYSMNICSKIFKYQNKKKTKNNI